MGERKRKERKRDVIKKTDQLPPIQLPRHPVLADKQRLFCKFIINQLLEDESSLSFSKPVDVLWDPNVLGDYFDTIKQPMDLGTILTNLDKHFYLNQQTSLFDPNAFRVHARLVFLNALLYNQRGTDLARLATRFLQFVDMQLAQIPLLPEQPTTPDSNQPEKTRSEQSIEQPSSPPHNPPADPTDPHPSEDPESLQIRSQIDMLIKRKKVAEAALAEMELMKNVPLTFEESSKLRDEVENLPWEKAEQVVAILRKYVDDALRDNNDEDPEFVTLEFSTVEPNLLREIEALIRPDPRVEKEKNTIQHLEEQIASAKRKLKAFPERESAKKKRKQRR